MIIKKETAILTTYKKQFQVMSKSVSHSVVNYSGSEKNVLFLTHTLRII